jgi:hypothetical protein
VPRAAGGRHIGEAMQCMTADARVARGRQVPAGELVLVVGDVRRRQSLFGYVWLKFNSHHINVPSNAWSTKCRLIACMSTQIRSNLRDESIKPN